MSTSTSSDLSPLCKECTGVFAQKNAYIVLTRHGFKQQRDLRVVKKSAREGCHFCQALISLIRTPPQKHTVTREDPVNSTIRFQWFHPSWLSSFSSFDLTDHGASRLKRLKRSSETSVDRTKGFQIYFILIPKSYHVDESAVDPHHYWLYVEISLWSKSYFGLANISSVTDNPAAAIFPERILNSNLTANGTYKLVQQWLRSCDSGHDQPCSSLCYTPTSLSVPTRLLDLDHSNGSGIIRLVDDGDMLTGSPYAALSYCWGGPQPHATVASNLEQYRESIDLDTLPQTIKDAIWVTRKLSLRYLWIDSMCIVQDSRADKNYEISRMNRVYGEAYLTIVAASAENCHEGFLMPREPQQQGTIRMPFWCPRGDTGVISLGFHNITYSSKFAHSFHNINEPLDDRAWALQERFMSPRTLLFSKIQLFWMCQKTFDRDGGAVTPEIYFADRGDSITRSRVTPSTPKTQSAWENLMEDYSHRKLTDCSDKLHAVSSIAAHWSAETKDDYMAGLWKGQILKGLCWQTQKTIASRLSVTTRDLGVAPSWSFMSVNLPVHWINDPEKYLVHLVKASINLEDPDLPFGKVREGVLHLSGCVLLVNPTRPIDPEQHMFRGKRGLETEYEIYYDMMTNDNKKVMTAFGPQDWRSSVWCLPISSGDYLFGLVLRRLLDGQYHRIGHFELAYRSGITLKTLQTFDFPAKRLVRII